MKRTKYNDRPRSWVMRLEYIMLSRENHKENPARKILSLDLMIGHRERGMQRKMYSILIILFAPSLTTPLPHIPQPHLLSGFYQIQLHSLPVPQEHASQRLYHLGYLASGFQLDLTSGMCQLKTRKKNGDIRLILPLSLSLSLKKSHNLKLNLIVLLLGPRFVFLAWATVFLSQTFWAIEEDVFLLLLLLCLEFFVGSPTDV